MRILYLAHRVPYPPNKGDKIRSYHHVRHLAAQHEVHLLSFFDQPEDAPAAADALRRLCHSVTLVQLHPRLALSRGVLALAAGQSLSEGYFGSAGMRRAVRRAIETSEFDVGWAYSSVMAGYLDGVRLPVRVADYVDVDSEKWLQFSAHARAPLSWAYAVEARRLRTFETRVARWADHVLFVSPAEAALFRRVCPTATTVRVIANGVDTDYFKPRAPAAGDPPLRLLFTGALDYRPNGDAVRFFVREVLPLIRAEYPLVEFTAVGHRPPAALVRDLEGRGPGIRVAGSVPDVRPYFREAAVYVAPLSLGRGVQNKVLEAMAMRVPVVASPLAVAGIEVAPGTHVLVADTAPAFARAVASLLGDPDAGRRLAAAAYARVQQRYSWDANLAALDACLAPSAAVTQKAWAAASSA